MPTRLYTHTFVWDSVCINSLKQSMQPQLSDWSIFLLTHTAQQAHIIKRRMWKTLMYLYLVLFNSVGLHKTRVERNRPSNWFCNECVVAVDRREYSFSFRFSIYFTASSSSSRPQAKCRFIEWNGFNKIERNRFMLHCGQPNGKQTLNCFSNSVLFYFDNFVKTEINCTFWWNSCGTKLKHLLKFVMKRIRK